MFEEKKKEEKNGALSSKISLETLKSPSQVSGNQILEVVPFLKKNDLDWAVLQILNCNVTLGAVVKVLNGHVIEVALQQVLDCNVRLGAIIQVLNCNVTLGAVLQVLDCNVALGRFSRY